MFQIPGKNGLDFANDIEPLIPPPVIYTYKEGYRQGDSIYNFIKIIWSPISHQMLFGMGTFN
jgi:hypothetical protein